MRPGIVVNGEQWEDAGPRPPPEPAPLVARFRVFDHLDAIPFELPPIEEDRHFSRVARGMLGGPVADRTRRSARWTSVPTYTAPEQIAGEIGGGERRAQRQR